MLPVIHSFSLFRLVSESESTDWLQNSLTGSYTTNWFLFKQHWETNSWLKGKQLIQKYAWHQQCEIYIVKWRCKIHWKTKRKRKKTLTWFLLEAPATSVSHRASLNMANMIRCYFVWVHVLCKSEPCLLANVMPGKNKHQQIVPELTEGFENTTDLRHSLTDIMLNLSARGHCWFCPQSAQAPTCRTKISCSF